MADILSHQYESMFNAPKEPMITPEVLFPNIEKLQGSSITDTDFDEDDIRDLSPERW